ncbi:type VI secretion system protein ImpF [Duganella sp. CF458]|uniref:type VI secretion system baseplate subunit TssE n=1 Tax=Duganella sp. CF458 TaxID=1884368 RepID=UPI0008F25CE8|nr:type VI secretion system baseplate subunit TssE [Duganella sp. CF458]SFG09436.1 type VI secretion system protein ImpF [Duganella sp. CF458]
MAELTPQERLQPALLDRLVDDAPEQKQETQAGRLLGKERLRAAVLRDLAWLFNAVRPGVDTGLARYEHVQRSVLNFGLPAMSGETASTLDLMGMERSIMQAILDFEPRIMASSLQVRALALDSMLDQHNIVRIEIRGDLWAQPAPLELCLRTEVDLETGVVQLVDLGKGA